MNSFSNDKWEAFSKLGKSTQELLKVSHSLGKVVYYDERLGWTHKEIDDSEFQPYGVYRTTL